MQRLRRENHVSPVVLAGATGLAEDGPCVGRPEPVLQELREEPPKSVFDRVRLVPFVIDHVTHASVDMTRLAEPANASLCSGEQRARGIDGDPEEVPHAEPMVLTVKRLGKGCDGFLQKRIVDPAGKLGQFIPAPSVVKG